MADMEFTLNIEPKTIQSGLRFSGKGGCMRVFRNSASKAYVRSLVFASKQYAKEQIVGPLRCDVTFVLKRPQRLKANGRQPAPVRPDRDNLLKPLQDALTQAMFWVDDSQIVAGETFKLYAGKTEKPCIEVKITKL
jgi:Holliday junction resolvase RusA-like endonuclease